MHTDTQRMILKNLSSTVGLENRKKSNHCAFLTFSGASAVDLSPYMCMFVCLKGDPGLPGPPGVPGPTVSYYVVIFLLSNHCTTQKTIYYLGNKLQTIR